MSPTFHIGHTHSQRVCFVGPFGVGKTTALRSISDIEVVNTDVATSERQAFNPDKSTTTVGFDYGELKLDGEQRIGLFGLPGQSRFDAMWQTLLPTSSAVVLWVYGNSPRAARDLTLWLLALKPCVSLNLLSVAVTRLPPDAEDTLGPMREALARFNPVAPLITADPRQASDVRLAVAIALAAVTVPTEQD